jgi:hypothetical protein
MNFSAILLPLFFATASSAAIVTDFIDDDFYRGLETMGIHDIETKVVHILLEGATNPLTPDEIELVNSAFKTTYNEIYGPEGFQMDEIDITEQQVHGAESKFVRNADDKFEVQFEQDSYVTLVAKLEGSSPAGLRVFGDADYLALQKRFWERKACQVILTGRYTPAQLRLCYMTSPRRRLQDDEKGHSLKLNAVME